MFLFLAMTCFLVSAEVDIAASVGQRLSEDLGWEGNFSVTYIGIEGRNYGLVRENATEMFVVWIRDDSVSIITDSDTVDLVLRTRQRHGFSDKIEEIRGYMMAFNQSRNAERECKISLGIDVAPCSDRDSCLKSCARSQYLCLPMAQGIGWSFVDEIVEFSKATLVMDVNLGDFSSGIDLFANEESNSLPSKALLDDVLKQVETIQKNDLFGVYTGGGYEFCSLIPYREDAILDAKARLDELNASFSANDSLVAVRNRIIKNTRGMMDAVQASIDNEKALLEDIKTNASKEFATAYETSTNLSQTVISKNLEERLAAVNKSLEGVMLSENSTQAAKEYLVFKNKKNELMNYTTGLVREFDSLIALSNLCSSSLIEADANITSSSAKTRFDQLRKRKEELDVMMGPPVDENYIGSIKAELNSIKNQARVLALEDSADAGGGVDYTYLVAALLVLVVFGGVGYLVKTKRVSVAPLNALSPDKKTEPAAKREEPLQDGTKEPAPTKKTPPASQYYGKLVLRGGAYRSSIRISVRGKGGERVPDGTTVKFFVSEGAITPSAVTKNGVVYARMAFKNKPTSANVTVSTMGIEKIARITF